MCSMTLPNIFIQFLAFIDPQNRQQFFFSLNSIIIQNTTKVMKDPDKKKLKTFANYFTIKIRH